VCLVDDQIVPLDLHNAALLLQTRLIRGDQHIKLAGLQKILAHMLSLLLRAEESDGADGRAPFLELSFPIGDCGLGDDDNMTPNLRV
jgi:hypothetical protein